MARRKSTLRRLSPVTKELAKLQADAQLLSKRLDRIVDKVKQLESDSHAYQMLTGGPTEDFLKWKADFEQGGIKLSKTGRVVARKGSGG